MSQEEKWKAQQTRQMLTPPRKVAAFNKPQSSVPAVAPAPAWAHKWMSTALQQKLAAQQVLVLYLTPVV